MTQTISAQKAVLVNRYATPLAIILVGLGIILAQPEGRTKAVSIGLLVFSAAFNQYTIWLIERSETASRILNYRLAVNLSVNAVLVYLLGDYWPQIWLLLTLTPIATAIYMPRAKTVAAAITISLIMFGIQALRPINSPLSWGIQIGNAAFVILMSLMVNALSQIHRSEQPS